MERRRERSNGASSSGHDVAAVAAPAEAVVGRLGGGSPMLARGKATCAVFVLASSVT